MCTAMNSREKRMHSDNYLHGSLVECFCCCCCCGVSGVPRPIVAYRLRTLSEFAATASEESTVVSAMCVSVPLPTMVSRKCSGTESMRCEGKAARLKLLRVSASCSSSELLSPEKLCCPWLMRRFLPLPDEALLSLVPAFFVPRELEVLDEPPERLVPRRPPYFLLGLSVGMSFEDQLRRLPLGDAEEADFGELPCPIVETGFTAPSGNESKFEGRFGGGVAEGRFSMASLGASPGNPLAIAAALSSFEVLERFRP
mmetsp:Transcript_70848/g.140558  ORF Transcript_70848/g.140558 Transcript_70848/m.140558 type:complete len:256 (+) Transcript_70848:1701-2468(+)